MRPPFGIAALGVLLGLLAGCGDSGSKLVPVTGTVRLDGTLVEHAALTFSPDETTKTQGGVGVTGADGKYTVTGPQGGSGLAPGTYKVVISRMLRKHGTPPPPDVPPIESDARETLPAVYSSPEKSTLTATVEPGKPIDFDLKSGKK